jgi:hypothetical protein
MRIGIDFDNTIADYEGVFHAAALERGLIDADLPKGKNAVRDFLNGSGRKDDFTALQGHVYGLRMDLARPYPGVREFIATARTMNQDVFIVSHKTRFPLLGPKHDMHKAACAFLAHHGISGAEAVSAEHIYFEETKEQKVGRAVALDLDVFIDDLPEVLLSPGFPVQCRKILFAPAGAQTNAAFEVCESWPAMTTLLLGERR